MRNEKMGCFGTLLMWTIGLPLTICWKILVSAFKAK